MLAVMEYNSHILVAGALQCVFKDVIFLKQFLNMLVRTDSYISWIVYKKSTFFFLIQFSQYN